jgi:flagellar biosynthetic protein FliS
MTAPALIASDRVLEQAVLTASPEQLIDMVMEHVLLHLSLASACKDQGWGQVQIHLHKAQQGVTLLLTSLAPREMAGLDHQGVSLVDNLGQLYNFVIESLVQSDLKQDLSAVPGLMKVISNIHAGWKSGVMRQAA